jgi:RimJ/RimL family protein N-acetyltransferase
VLQTERLILRNWREEDLEPFAAMNADPRVMEFFPARLSRAESDELAGRISARLIERGWGLYAVESKATGDFLGFTGLSVPTFLSGVEIGWRFAPAVWGQGLATEAARAVAQVAFSDLKLPELVSFTSEANLRSRRVMEKLGMTHRPEDDFYHPGIPEGHPLRRHVLYRLERPF